MFGKIKEWLHKEPKELKVDKSLAPVGDGQLIQNSGVLWGLAGVSTMGGGGIAMSAGGKDVGLGLMFSGGAGVMAGMITANTGMEIDRNAAKEGPKPEEPKDKTLSQRRAEKNQAKESDKPSVQAMEVKNKLETKNQKIMGLSK